MRNQRWRAPGFTLVEALLALALVSLTFLFLLGIMPVSYRAVSEARNTYLANEICSTQLNNLVALGYTNLSSMANGSTATPTTSPVSVTSVSNGIQAVTQFNI